MKYLKQAFEVIKGNPYAVVVTIGMFLMGFEVVDTWAGYALPSLCLLGYGIYKMFKKKDL